MTIKVLATDMDGTLLTSNMDYDRERFERLFQVMQEKGIRFVAISGNQYYQIKSFFPNLQDKITIVGENGAYIVENGIFLKSYRLPNEIVRTVLDYLREHDMDDELVLCGEASAYILKSAKPEAKDYFALYYHNLIEVDAFEFLPADHFMKFSFNTPEEVTMDIIAHLNDLLGDQVQAVSSGHDNIDVIAKGIHKGAAMTYLLDYWGISSNQLAAFGDGGNDLEMIELAKYSYAMENGSQAAKDAAKFIAPSNDVSGVMEIIEKLLKDNKLKEMISEIRN
ncbi:HAD-superfamily hydrolase / phosphatase [Streptococcus varani]|uniref:HAD-superfamily hydrolase / phosphatase n=1 Tax=Streptococcus varani TaxID=1608583 RepID=A0A0E3WEZ0_9STRE|nr:Cof-type HAD-IIB family hydrolase [Streptococcus varani]CQR24562.1 HAD-superfamily hydrolase / phosphatase [Streptococcus varani]